VNSDYISVTEIAGDEVTQEQVDRLCNRYYWAGQYCSGKDVVEVACGSGQGLGYLSGITRSLEAGDYSDEILSIARRHYGERIALRQFDAQDMPFADRSKDVIILFEAIYYLPDAERFVQECVRVLRPGGKVLIATANKDLYDFNPSPHTYKYYGVVELRNLFAGHGFTTEFYGDTPLESVFYEAEDSATGKKSCGCNGVYAQKYGREEDIEEDRIWRLGKNASRNKCKNCRI